MSSACVTGASGFVGSHLVRRLRQDGWRVATPRVRVGAVDGFSPRPGDVVYHLAATAHRRDRGLDACMAANCRLAVDLYQRSHRAEAGGFVHLSSSKALGDTGAGSLDEDAPRRPVGPYAYSKAAAEEELLAQSARLGLPLSIVRPPLTYGPGVRANFLALLTALARGWPLPLASATGMRSWVSVGNLTNALAALGGHLQTVPSAAIWHVTDGEDIDVADLCRRIAANLGRSPRLWPLPRTALLAAARASGNYGISTSQVASIFDPLRLDDTALRGALGWSPPQSLDAALDETVRWFRRRQSGNHRALVG